MTVLNTTRNSIVVERLKIARNLSERLRGLIGSPPLGEREGLLIPYCKGIHTIGMRYPLDVIYLDRDGKVLKLIEPLPPNSIGHIVLTSNSVLELPVGAIRWSSTRIGDALFIQGASESSNGDENSLLKYLRAYLFV
ncbi:MAG: hypothetical protein A3G87_01855 [Omnitrophica bacterium RIFCSPLOWO2_12_FULL_50_11]|nr:MAG: hypothetical protein A3G87_01855 [Omnitrophica bacterium RIFCSPLOWO2_12_FULL_50_11]